MNNPKFIVSYHVEESIRIQRDLLCSVILFQGYSSRGQFCIFSSDTNEVNMHSNALGFVTQLLIG